MELKNKVLDGSTFWSKWRWILQVELYFWLSKARSRQLVMRDCVIRNFHIEARHLFFVLGRLIYDN